MIYVALFAQFLISLIAVLFQPIKKVDNKEVPGRFTHYQPNPAGWFLIACSILAFAFSTWDKYNSDRAQDEEKAVNAAERQAAAVDRTEAIGERRLADQHRSELARQLALLADLNGAIDQGVKRSIEEQDRTARTLRMEAKRAQSPLPERFLVSIAVNVPGDSPAVNAYVTRMKAAGKGPDGSLTSSPPKDKGADEPEGSLVSLWSYSYFHPILTVDSVCKDRNPRSRAGQLILEPRNVHFRHGYVDSHPSQLPIGEMGDPYILGGAYFTKGGLRIRSGSWLEGFSLSLSVTDASLAVWTNQTGLTSVDDLQGLTLRLTFVSGDHVAALNPAVESVSVCTPNGRCFRSSRFRRCTYGDGRSFGATTWEARIE